MKKLAGSVAQVAWAEKIRAELLAVVDATNDAPRTLAVNREQRAELRTSILNNESAVWFIEWRKVCRDSWDMARRIADLSIYGI